MKKTKENEIRLKYYNVDYCSSKGEKILELQSDLTKKCPYMVRITNNLFRRSLMHELKTSDVRRFRYRSTAMSFINECFKEINEEWHTSMASVEYMDREKTMFFYIEGNVPDDEWTLYVTANGSRIIEGEEMNLEESYELSSMTDVRGKMREIFAEHKNDYTKI